MKNALCAFAVKYLFDFKRDWKLRGQSRIYDSLTRIRNSWYSPRREPPLQKNLRASVFICGYMSSVTRGSGSRMTVTADEIIRLMRKTGRESRISSTKGHQGAQRNDIWDFFVSGFGRKRFLDHELHESHELKNRKGEKRTREEKKDSNHGFHG